MRILKKENWFHPDGFQISVERRDPQEPFGLHTHDFSEIVIITGGTGLHVTGEDSWQLAKGDTFVISNGQPHDYQSMDNLRLINILFDQDTLSFDSMDLPSLPGYHVLFHLEPAWRKRHQFRSRLRLLSGDLRIAINLCDQLGIELKNRSAGFRFLGTALFMQLVGHVSRCYEASQNENSRELLRIGQTITHLEDNYRQNVNLEELVGIANMSKRSFLRAFEAATGCSPISYLIQIRINRAIDLLCETTRSITDIAYEVGFNDSNYFTRQFRRHHGVSPREYRKLNG